MIEAATPHPTWNPDRRAIGATGTAVAFSAAWLVTLVIWPSNLTVAASGAQIVPAYAGHEGVAIAQYVLAQGVAAAALAIVALAPGRAARRSGATAGRVGRAAEIAGLTAASVSLVQLVLGLLLSGWLVGDGTTARAHLLFKAINRLDGVKMLALAALAAAGVVLARAPRAGGTAVLPRWLGGAAAVLAVALVASAAGYLLLSPTLADAACVSLPLLLVWITGAGIALGRASRSGGPRALEVA